MSGVQLGKCYRTITSRRTFGNAIGNIEVEKSRLYKTHVMKKPASCEIGGLLFYLAKENGDRFRAATLSLPANTQSKPVIDPRPSPPT